jgi:Microtubule-Associated protein Jupiter
MIPSRCFSSSPSGDGRRAPSDSSHNRLFGDSDRGLATPAKNRLKSNIPIGGDESDATLKHSNGNGYTNSSREHSGSENGKSNYSERWKLSEPPKFFIAELIFLFRLIVGRSMKRKSMIPYNVRSLSSVAL